MVLKGRIADAKLVAAFSASVEPETQTPAEETPKPKEKPKNMTFKERLKALFSTAVDEMPDEDLPNALPVVKPKVEDSAEFAAMKAENDRLKASFAASQDTRLN
ncbi:MAG: hypothetical protein ABL962_19745, partial [Fimbriimonadaceae bacterium]